MSISETNLYLSLASRQKLLQFLKKLFLNDVIDGHNLPEGLKNKLKVNIETFGQLLNKYPLIREETERKECEDRLCSMEREFNNLAENRRLLTSKYGLASVDGNRQ